MPNKTIAIDFDNCIHSLGGFDGLAYGDPIPGAFEAINRLQKKGYDIIILTARENLEEVRIWLDYQIMNKFGDRGKLGVIPITNIKPAAIAYIDDRGIRFTCWRDLLNYF